MGNPVLGKGMKDLLPKKFEVQNKEKEKSETSLDELKVTIKRYRAQGFNVDMLVSVKDSPIEEVRKGMEEYRNSIKKLKSAMTILKSLEGYGYNYEIDQIMEDIKDPSKADSIHKEAEKLRKRAFSEHDIHTEKKFTPGEKVLRSLKTRTDLVNGKDEKNDVDNEKLDELLNNLDGLGDDLDLNLEEEDLLGGEDEVEHPPEEVSEEEVQKGAPVETDVLKPPEDIDVKTPSDMEEGSPEKEVESDIPTEDKPTADKPPDLDALMEKAKDMYKRGDLPGSLKAFEEILKWDQENAKARFMIRRLKGKIE